MTQDEIIEMAIEAEFVSHGKPSDEESELFVCVDKDIYKFAKLVAAKAEAKEREACAKVAEEYGTWGGSGFYEWFKKLGAEIRARGEQA
jgi:hypothetical protein